MSQEHLAKLACSACKRINYMTTRNKKQVQQKLDLSKHCEWCKKHTKHKEVKK